MNRYRWFSLSFVILVLFSAALFLHPHDRTLLLQIQESHDPGLDRIAAEVSHWGDFLFFNIGGAMFIWLFGYVRGLRWVQRLAYSALFGAICAGVVCNAFRLTMGRARPKAMVEDRFYGFQGTLQGWNYHGFPSGHTSTAFGAGVPLVTAAGVWGAPILVVSVTVGWSRLYKNQHYPTDVFVGAALGLLFGTATSWHLRKVRLRLKRSKRRQKRSSAIDPDVTRNPSGNRKSLVRVRGASRHRDRESSIVVR